MMKITVLANLLLIVSTSALAQGVNEISYESVSKSLPCVSRIGRCFDATIAGIKVTAIKEKAKQEQMFRDAKGKNKSVRSFYWELTQEVDGDKVLDIETMSNAYGLAHVGEEEAEPDIMITPLQEQELTSTQSIAPASGVSIGGKPVLTQQNTLDQEYLPPGEYIISIRYNGAENWDRKMVYVKVKAADAARATVRPSTPTPAQVKPITSSASTAESAATSDKPSTLTTMQAGGWEVRTTVTATDAKTTETTTMLDGMLMKFCYTQAFVDKHPYLTPNVDKEKMEKKNAQCSISNEKRTNNAASWHMNCTLQDKSHAFSIISNTVSATSFQMNMLTAISRQDNPPAVTMKLAGTFIGACTPDMMVN